jgi:hypothetical protein
MPIFSIATLNRIAVFCLVDDLGLGADHFAR